MVVPAHHTFSGAVALAAAIALAPAVEPALLPSAPSVTPLPVKRTRRAAKRRCEVELLGGGNYSALSPAHSPSLCPCCPVVFAALTVTLVVASFDGFAARAPT